MSTDRRVQVTKRFTLEMAHALRDHDGPCKHIHGHSYVLDVTLTGEPLDRTGDPKNGMVMDFADLKAIAKQHVVDVWDHAFLAYRGDTAVVSFLQSMPGHKTVLLDVVPTAENLAAEAFRILDPLYRDVYGNHLRLERVRLFETPNCWADALRSELD